MTGKVADDRQYWPAKDAARMLGFSTTTLRNWAIEGRIEAVLSPGGKYRYNVAGFLALARSASKKRLDGKRRERKQRQAERQLSMPLAGE